MSLGSIVGVTPLMNKESFNQPLMPSSPVILLWRKFFQTSFQSYYSALSAGRVPFFNYQYFWPNITAVSRRGIRYITITPLLYNPSSSENERLIKQSIRRLEWIAQDSTILSQYEVNSYAESSMVCSLNNMQLIQLFSSLVHLFRANIECFNLFFAKKDPIQFSDNEVSLEEDSVIRQALLKRLLKSTRKLQLIYKQHEHSLEESTLVVPSLLSLSVEYVCNTDYSALIDESQGIVTPLTPYYVRTTLSVYPEIEEHICAQGLVSLLIPHDELLPKLVLRKNPEQGYCKELDLLPMQCLMPNYEEKLKELIIQRVLEVVGRSQNTFLHF